MIYLLFELYVYLLSRRVLLLMTHFSCAFVLKASQKAEYYILARAERNSLNNRFTQITMRYINFMFGIYIAI